MATRRPASLILEPTRFDSNNGNIQTNGKISKLDGHSSSSSIDSSIIKKTNVTARKSLPETIPGTTTPTTTTTTTTDSDVDSEQEDTIDGQQKKSSLSKKDQISRRMKHFRKLFKSEIPDETPDLIDSYVCAYQGDILLQGKMYITDRYLCFHSRIINYVTKHVHRWEDIQGVTKERVAYIFPTAIGIQLKSSSKKLIYASFISRDQAFDKILLIWSRSTGELHSINADDENEGTLKANGTDGTNKYSKSNIYPNIDPAEQEVLQMCLKTNHSDDKQRLHSVSSKSSNEKSPPQKTKSSMKKRSTSQSAQLEAKMSNKTNPSGRTSRFSKKDKKNDQSSRENSKTTSHRSHSRVLQANGNDDRISLTNNTNTSLSPLNSLSTSTTNPSDASLTNTSDISSYSNNSLFSRLFQFVMSFLNKIIQYLSTMSQQLKSYPFKTTLFLFIFILVLVFHSFYLIQLAYRIEDRLHSLYQRWPSSSMKNSFSSSTLKNSLPSNKEL